MKTDSYRQLRIGMEATHGLVSCKTLLAPGRDSIWRYDKWRTMIWPRLRLLLVLFSDSGALLADAKRSEPRRWR